MSTGWSRASNVSPSVIFWLVNRLMIWLVHIGWRWTNEEGTCGKLEDCHVSLPKGRIYQCTKARDLHYTKSNSYHDTRALVLNILWFDFIFDVICLSIGGRREPARKPTPSSMNTTMKTGS